MKQIEFATAGKPEHVVRYADAPAPSATAPDDVLVRVLAFPINPADLLTMQGIYPRLDAAVQAIGSEAVGEIAATGSDVTGLTLGDRVILLSVNNWREYRLVKANDVVKISPQGDILQQSGLKVNPATASLLLHQFVELKADDWIIQNVANSAVGRAAIQLAHMSGVRTVNLVRRSDVMDELKSLGADVVLLDGDDLAGRIRAATGNASIPLGIDGVGGVATDRIASCLAPGATLVIYGAMSGKPATIASGAVVFNDLRIRGLWLSRYLMGAPRDAIDELYRRLDQLSVTGRLTARIDSVFRADDIKSAVRRASEAGINGKVIVRFN
jgi:NADPH:quinone reductase-like Zn-dependent oxidoreductase